jgi:hypothetical protein
LIAPTPSAFSSNRAAFDKADLSTALLPSAAPATPQVRSLINDCEMPDMSNVGSWTVSSNPVYAPLTSHNRQAQRRG